MLHTLRGRRGWGVGGGHQPAGSGAAAQGVEPVIRMDLLCVLVPGTQLLKLLESPKVMSVFCMLGGDGRLWEVRDSFRTGAGGQKEQSMMRGVGTFILTGEGREAED